jgi:hypothetical protein
MISVDTRSHPHTTTGTGSGGTSPPDLDEWIIKLCADGVISHYSSRMYDEPTDVHDNILESIETCHKLQLPGTWGECQGQDKGTLATMLEGYIDHLNTCTQGRMISASATCKADSSVKLGIRGVGWETEGWTQMKDGPEWTRDGRAVREAYESRYPGRKVGRIDTGLTMMEGELCPGLAER